ncbi:MAG: MCE family protein [Phycisphaeraceae bacterium]|nr:MCE family protein [Phycisphaerales bacterium]MCB9860247.1 MCE family protein [Phycisphaeraceae bacterium]
MSRRRPKRNNVIAGVFLVSGLVLAVATSAVLSDAMEYFKPKTQYVVRFDIATGSGGLSSGSAVTLGGQKIGRVSSVNVNPAVGIDVTIAVNSDIVINENANASLVVPLLGAGGTLNFTSLGDPSRLDSFHGTSARLEAGEVLAAGIAPPGFLAQAGFGPEQVATLRNVIENADSTMERVDSIATKFQESLPGIVDEVEASIEDARTAVNNVQTMTEKAGKRFDVWADEVDSVLANANAASDKLPALVDNANEGVSEARKVISTTQGVIDEAEPKIIATLDSVKSSADHFDTHTIREVDNFLTDAREMLRTAEGPIVAFGQALAEEMPGLRKVFANLRLASDQAKLAMVEIRNSPWRILYQPSRKEIEQELEFGAARTYADAVSDLRAASEALQALAQFGDGVDQAEIQRLQNQLLDAFMRYQKLEEQMLSQLAEAGT